MGPVEAIDAGENLCVPLAVSSSSGSCEVVVSLITDDALLLMMDALSKAPRGPATGVMADIPEMEDAPDRKPPKWPSFTELETGRLSGKRALTMVIKSAGPSTRYGWTSTVSLKEVIDLAGRSFAFDLEGRLDRNLAIMFSMCTLIPSGVDDDLFLQHVISHEQEEPSLSALTKSYPPPVSVPSLQLLSKSFAYHIQ